MNDIFTTVLPTVVTAIVGAMGTAFGYITGRKKKIIDLGVAGSVALRELTETNDLLSQRVNDLYEAVLSLRKENAQLLANQEALKLENEKLLKVNAQLLTNQKRLEEQLETLTQELQRYKKKH